MRGKRKRSAGILAFRLVEGALEVLLIHPGGPFWAKKDAGTRSIPKGLYAEDEGALVAAKREFEEETGLKPVGDLIELGAFRQPSGKTISAWAIENGFDISALKSNTLSMEWPPRSCRRQEFPGANRAQWFGLAEARRKITKGQVAVVEVLAARVNA